MTVTSKQLTVFAAGKLKDLALEDLCSRYTVRSRRFIPIDVREHRNHTCMWAAATRTSAPVVLLDERGLQITTPEFAKKISTWQQSNRLPIFLIGDSHGFTQDDRDRADVVISLSKLTLPHKLARLLLLEQLYRASTILAGHPYHHASDD